MDGMANQGYRKEQRLIAISHRVKNGFSLGGMLCKCDYCGVRAGTTMHEIFPRSLTRDDTEQRYSCYHHTVVSMLCPTCHTKVQYNIALNRELLEFNMLLFGSSVLEHINYMRSIGVPMSLYNAHYTIE